MAINKKLIHFKTFSNFNSKKLSANEENTTYTLGVEGSITTGNPEILYTSICWIKDVKMMWTHGTLYDCSGGAGEENVQSDWMDNSSTDAFIKNRTHYVSGTKITSAGTYTVSGSQIYFDGNIYNLELGVKTTLKSGPYVYATLTSVTSLTIEDSSKYTAASPITVINYIKKLDDIYLSDNIVKNTSLKTINGNSILGSGNISVTPQSNEIWYTSSDNGVIVPDESSGFGANIISNTCVNGQGIITFDAEITKIGAGAFANKSLTSIIIPNSVTTIENQAFSSTYLTSITFPDKLISIERWAFAQCGGITEISLPKTLTTLGGYAFYGCPLNTIHCYATTPPIGGEDMFACSNVYVPINSIDAYKTANYWNWYPTSYKAILDTSNIKTINGESIIGNGDVIIEIPEAVTESTISGWGFTKNTGSYSKPATGIPADDLANTVQACLTLATTAIQSESDPVFSASPAASISENDITYWNRKQPALNSGTNIKSVCGDSILGSGDLYSPVIITDDVVKNTKMSVGNIYIFQPAMTTAQRFELVQPSTYWNNAITIIIKTSSTITFATTNSQLIFWANGTTPTFETDKIYEISFRYTPMGWLGVAAAFYNE